MYILILFILLKKTYSGFISKQFQQILVRPWSIIIILSLLEVLVAFLTTYSGLTFDEAIWHYIGRNWFRHGMVPYSGGIDNKSPLIYIIYGISDLLFGINYWFPRVTGYRKPINRNIFCLQDNKAFGK